jgi:hypothetical protein
VTRVKSQNSDGSHLALASRRRHFQRKRNVERVWRCKIEFSIVLQRGRNGVGPCWDRRNREILGEAG